MGVENERNGKFLLESSLLKLCWILAETLLGENYHHMWESTRGQAAFEQGDESIVQSLPNTSFTVEGAPCSTSAGCLSFKEGLCQPPYFAMSASASFGPQLPRGYGRDAG